jgi:GT2 family glycosyltransferase
MKTSFNLLNHPAIFAAPARWTEAEAGRQHLPFLFYVVSMLRPRVLVEAGTTTGGVYCGFCQIVAAEKLPTRCLAFPAQPQQITALRTYHDPLYGNFSQLMTQASAEGLSQLADGSVDLLHFASDATDLALWLPKLSPRGIVIIPSLNSLSEATAQAWEQAKAQYPHFTFTHDGGLGLLVVGDAAAPELLALGRLSDAEAKKVQGFFSQLGWCGLSIHNGVTGVDRRAVEVENELARLRIALAGKEKQIERLQTQLTQRKHQLHNLTEKYTEAVNSDAWWMLSQYWIWRCKFFPVASRRERGLKSLTRVLRILRQFGLSGTLKKVRGRLQRRLKTELDFRQDFFNSVKLPASWQQDSQRQVVGRPQQKPKQSVDEHTLKLVHTRPPIAVPKLELFEVETAVERAPHLPRASVSVVIPSWNAGDEFALLLSSLAAQQGCDCVEIIIVDSGSTDGTVKLARDYGARVIEISQAEFSHSHARNLGAQVATCEYLLFMVQDALPASNLWLHELIAAAQRLDVVAATCVESPREDADLLARLLGTLHTEYLGAAEKDRVFSQPETVSYNEIRRNCQLNNVACLIERQVFDRYGFQGAYAEDLDLGMRLGQDGHRMAALNTVKVVHSHNRAAYYHLKRGYVDCTMMAELFADYPEPPPIDLGKLGKEALASFQLLEAVVAQLRDSAIFPLPLGTLSALLIKHIEQAYKNPVAGLAYPFNPNRDAYTQFLTKLAALSSDTAQVKFVGTSFALGVSGMLISLFDYLEGIYEVADAGLLASIGEFLQKIHALQLGAYLASSASAGRAEAPVIEWIETELRKGV